MKINKIKLFTIILFISLNFYTASVYSSTLGEQENNNEVNNMDEMIASVNLEKKQIEYIVMKLVRSGRLTPEEGEKARREIASVKDTDVEGVKSLAIKELLRQSN